MVRFKVCIGQHEHRSEDGTTWSRHRRELPSPLTPVLRGHVDLEQLPALPPGAHWDFATLQPSGFGVAVGHEPVDGTTTRATIFVTNDGGRHWVKRDARPRLPFWRWGSWPAEQFASLVLPSPGVVALAWDDPWLHEGPLNHFISSQDGGESWHYHGLDKAIPSLALDHTGRLLALSDRSYMETRDSGKTWMKSTFTVDWPEGSDQNRAALLRHVTFIGGDVAYSLIVHWRPGSTQETPPDVGLLATTDNGRRWSHLHLFEGPKGVDINERHVLDLRVM